MSDGKRFNVQVDTELTISSVRTLINAKMGIQPQFQRIYLWRSFGLLQSDDDAKTLSQLCITAHDRLYVRNTTNI
jgi:hypothetical protein